MRKRKPFDSLFAHDENDKVWVKATEVIKGCFPATLYEGLAMATFDSSLDTYITADDAIDLLLKHAEEHSDEETRTLDSIKIAIIVREQRKGKFK